MADKLIVTTGREWRKVRENGQPVRLPTGRVALLRPATPEELLLFGKIPNKLATLVAKMIQEGQYIPKETENVVATAREFLELSKILVKAIFLSPKIVDTPEEDDEIGFFDLSPVDREWAIGWAQAPTVSLEPFRDETGTVESSHNS